LVESRAGYPRFRLTSAMCMPLADIRHWPGEARPFPEMTRNNGDLAIFAAKLILSS